ncbi:hypothetical protein R84981_002766 [Carnimonas sp. R-84981]|uniref:KilA-N domain-containing protein n=1 Tax=Carnimonas bestiolae TaxID=3402172 RepID=UPI003EDBDDF4
MSNVIPMKFEGKSVHFDLNGWMNAADIAKEFGKRPVDWLRQPETVEYMVKRGSALGLNCGPEPQLRIINSLERISSSSRSKLLSIAKKSGMLRVVAGRNGGTWLHPKMAVKFARWLSVDFEIWCDIQIENILESGTSLRMQLEDAIDALEHQKERGSRAGRELAMHKQRKPPLERRVLLLFDKVQGKLPLEVVA